MLKKFVEWLIELILAGENMSKLYKTFLLILCISLLPAKDKYSVTGVVQNSGGEGIKKVNLILLDSDENEIADGKSKKGGKFKFKKIKPGTYLLIGMHKNEGSGETNVIVVDDNVSISLIISTDPVQIIPTENESLVSVSDSTRNPDTLPLQPEENLDNQESISESAQEIPAEIGLEDTLLDSSTLSGILPQQRERKPKNQLSFDETFFQYESNLKRIQAELDSLKSVVKGYEKKQTMPDVSRELLKLIQVPEFQHRVELQNGTVVIGDILEESDSTLILKTQIGELVLKKRMVVRLEEYDKPGPKVIFLGEPFVDYYPDYQIFSGRIKNVGEKRADFVRVLGFLWDQGTSNAGTDSVFVKGTRIAYNSNVIADTALDPEQTANYILTIPIDRGKKVQYHTLDIHWDETY